MRLISFLLLLSLLLPASDSFAGRHKHKTVGKTTLADPAEGNYDIKYLRFNLNASDTSVYISGNVSTTAQVIVASMSTYVFELNTSMNIDSVKVNGNLLSVATSGDVRTITLPAALPLHTMFTAQVFYHGEPPSGSTGFFNGITHQVSSGGTNMVFTVSDPYVAQNWWPTKQSVDDKIDSVDMFVTVPADVMDGSNGVLVNVDSTSIPGYWTYHWQTHYAIDYYLISLAMARYAEYRSYMHFSGSTDSMLIQNFFADTATFNPLYKVNFDSISQFIDYFSSVYGRYPFWQEKYGVCYTTLPGGMEHQTMTTIGVPNTYIIAHELSHQWFGDHVTYATWGDVWLSEGFATFSEQLFYTHFWGAVAGKTHRQQLMNSVFTDPCGMVYVNDTTTSDSLFFQPTVYDKGQAVVTMLRYLAPTDSMFFLVLQTYQQQYAFGNASTANLKAIAESIYGTNLDTFFNQWIYGRGYPRFQVAWDQVGTTVYVRLIQTASCPSSTPLFSTPVELQFHSTTGDTVVKVYNNADTTLYTFTWSPTMSTIYLNPDYVTLCQQLSISHIGNLGTGSVVPLQLNIQPNPSNNYWEISQLPDDTSLVLTDMSGRILWQGKSVHGNTVVPGEHLPTGDYLLKLSNGSEQSIKLVHW